MDHRWIDHSSRVFMLPSANPGMQQACGDPSRSARVVRPSLRRRPGNPRIFFHPATMPSPAMWSGSSMARRSYQPRAGRTERSVRDRGHRRWRSPCSTLGSGGFSGGTLSSASPGEAMVVDRATGRAASWDTRLPLRAGFRSGCPPRVRQIHPSIRSARIPRNLPIRRFFWTSQSMCQYIQLSRWRGHVGRTCWMGTGLMPRMIRRHRLPVAFREDCMIPRSGDPAHGSDRAMRTRLDLAEFKWLMSA